MSEPAMTEERARELLAIKPGDDLNKIQQFVCWFEDGKDILLDGNFTADQLEAIAFLMRRKV